MTDREIFINAPAGASPEVLDAYLEKACGGDAELRARVEALVAADAQAGEKFLETGMPLGERPTELAHTAEITEKGGDVIGRYKLLEKIGEGGFGDVYVAEQLEPVKRRVAFKIIKLGMDTRQVVARFEAERQALALMDHPNIAKVLDAGATETGRPFFVMELVKGVPVTRFCDEQGLSTEERLELFTDVCRAVQHAHQKGVIHRDLKPSNVMVTLHDDKAVVKVIDFGVAKATQGELTDKTIYTRFEQFIGTPAYMSPEQAQLSGLDIDTRSDIYALGVLLYELLTGRTPFDAKELASAGYEEIRRVIREEEPPKPSTRLSTLEDEALMTLARMRRADPRKLRTLLRGDLDWIVMKALEKDRTRRYETANALAVDVGRHLSNEPVTAARPSSVYRLQKYIQRNKGVVTSLAAVISILTIGVVGMTLLFIEMREQKEIAEKKGEEAMQSGRTAREAAGRLQEQAAAFEKQAYTAGIGRANLLHREQDFALMSAVMEACPENLRAWEWHWLNQSINRGRTVVEGMDDIWAGGAWFTPNGDVLTLRLGGICQLWNPDNGEERLTLKQDGAMYGSQPAFNPDGTEVYLCGSDLVGRWDLSTGALLETHELDGCLSVHVTEGGVLAHARDDWLFELAESGFEPVCDLERDRSGQFEFASKFSHDGRVIAVLKRGDKEGKQDWNPIWDRAVTYDTRSGRILGEADGSLMLPSMGAGSFAALEKDGFAVSVASPDGRGFSRISWADGRASSAVVSRDGDRVYLGEVGGRVVSRDLVTGELLGVLGGHSSAVFKLDISPDGQQVLSASKDGSVRIWQADVFDEAFELRGHQGPLRELAFSPEGDRLISVAFDSTARVWDGSDGREVRRIYGGGRLIAAVDFSPDGRHVVTGGWGDEVTRIWDVVAGRHVRTLGAATNVSIVKYSPCGTRIAAAGTFRQISIWDAFSGEPKGSIPFVGRKSDGLSFSPDGRHIAFSEIHSGSVQLHDAETGEHLKELRGPPATQRTVSFSEDGKLLASGGTDRRVRVWDVESGELLHLLPGHKDTVLAVAFGRGRSGDRLFSGGRGGTIYVWDPSSGEQLVSIRLGATIWGMAVSPGGDTVAVSLGDGVIRMLESRSPSAATREMRRWVGEARKLVERRSSELDSPAAVVESLFGDKSVEPEVKKLALEYLQVGEGVRAAGRQ